MRHSMIVRLLTSLALLLLLSACTTRPGPEVLEVPRLGKGVEGARMVTVYVATKRARARADRNVFTNEPADAVNYAAFTISIPPKHKAGEIEWPKEDRADPKTSFVVVGQRVLDEKSFYRDVGRKPTGEPSEVGVFVHGFNTNFEEALFRQAQINADSDNGSRTPILFAWPSQASVTGYLADKDAATASRDGLTTLLDTLGRDKGVGKVTLIGHSMGGWLSAEALRQLRLSGKTGVFSKLTVFLAAPDVDVEVFRSQLAVIGPLNPPMTVLVSRDDRALAASRILAGKRERIGALDVNDPRVQETARLGKLQVIDISSLSSSDSFNHNRFAQVASLAPILVPGNTEAAGREETPGTFVLDALGATLTAPITILTGQAGH